MFSGIFLGIGDFNLLSSITLFCIVTILFVLIQLNVHVRDLRHELLKEEAVYLSHPGSWILEISGLNFFFFHILRGKLQSELFSTSQPGPVGVLWREEAVAKTRVHFQLKLEEFWFLKTLHRWYWFSSASKWSGSSGPPEVASKMGCTSGRRRGWMLCCLTTNVQAPTLLHWWSTTLIALRHFCKPLTRAWNSIRSFSHLTGFGKSLDKLNAAGH